MGFFDKLENTKKKTTPSELGIKFDRVGTPEDVRDVLAGREISNRLPTGMTLREQEESKQRYENKEFLKKAEAAKKRIVEADKKAAIDKALTLKQLEYTAAQEKAEMLAKEKFREKVAYDQYLKKAAYEKEYGPGQFEIGGKKLTTLAKINQARNWQQAQDLKQQKMEAAIAGARRNTYVQQAQLQQARQQAQAPMQFGMGLSMGGIGGFGAGIGSQQNNPFAREEQMQGQPEWAPGRFNAGLSLPNAGLGMPVIAGLGGSRRQEEQYQEQPQQVQYVQQPQQVQRTPNYGPSARPGYGTPATYMKPRAQVPVDISISVFRKTSMPYGSKYTKIDPAEALPNEPLYRRIQEKYGHRFERIN